MLPWYPVLVCLYVLHLYLHFLSDFSIAQAMTVYGRLNTVVARSRGIQTNTEYIH